VVVTAQATSDVKSCPSCGEEVKATAKVCRYCNYSFVGRRPARLRRTRPTELLSVAFTLVSVAVAGLAFVEARQVSKSQQAFQQRAEEEQSAPILAPDTLPDKRGKRIHVFTAYASLWKRSDRLYVNSDADATHPGRGRIVIPVRNGGAGIGLTVGLPVMVQDCDHEPRLLPAGAVGLLGTYVIPSGGTDQLSYLAPLKPSAFLPEAPRGGYVVRGQKRLWYNWDYGRFGPTGGTANLLLWYTDSAQHELRWTCMTYGLTQRTSSTSEWALTEQQYGKRALPNRLIPST
jgi:hypothetical protein